MIAAVSILLQGLEADCFDIAAEESNDGAGFGRRILPNDSGGFMNRSVADVIRRRVGEQFEEDDAECIHVAADIDVVWICVTLLRRHVLHGADERAHVSL